MAGFLNLGLNHFSSFFLNSVFSSKNRYVKSKNEGNFRKQPFYGQKSVAKLPPQVLPNQQFFLRLNSELFVAKLLIFSTILQKIPILGEITLHAFLLKILVKSILQAKKLGSFAAWSKQAVHERFQQVKNSISKSQLLTTTNKPLQKLF